MAKNVLTYNLSEPLGGAKTAKIDIDNGDGNMVIDPLTSGEQLLASGTLQYLESQGQPTCSASTSQGQATLTLKQSSGKGQPWFRLPWAACNGATEWRVRLNPSVRADITALSGGGNVRINLAGMEITGLMAETGGGNMDVTLPDHAANLNVTVKSGAGAVTVEIGSGLTGLSTINAGSGAGTVMATLPGNIAARIHVTSGMGKVIVDPRFSKIGANTYQSPDYDRAADKVEITLKSGAGNVIVKEKMGQPEAVSGRI